MLHKRKIQLLITVLIAWYGSSAQEVIATGGGSLISSSSSIDFTIGEVLTATHSNSNAILTQGLHGGKLMVIPLAVKQPSVDLTFFPNPVQDQLNIQSTENEMIQYWLINTKGEVVNSGSMRQSTQLDLSSLASGIYFLKVYSQDRSWENSYKILKPY